MKILMVVNDMRYFWSHREPLLKGILAHGWQLELAAPFAEKDKKLQEYDLKTYSIPNHTHGLHPREIIKIVKEIQTVIEQSKPDLVYSLTIRHAFFTGLALQALKHKTKKRIPSVLMIAGLGSLFTAQTIKAKIARLIATPLLRYAFKGAEIIVQNPDDFAVLEHSRIVPVDRMTLIKSSGVDVQQFPFTPLPDTDVPMVLFSSRLVRDKGVADFVAAARILKEKGIKARFVVAGDIYPQNPNSLTRAEIQSWHDEGVIEWLGHVTNMPLLMQDASLFVMPSYYREGVPKVTLEAMATGRPVLTTDMPGCRETVEDGVTGYLIEIKDGADIASKIEILLESPDMMQAMGKAARIKAETEFSVESVVKRTLEVYDLAIEKSKT